MPTTAYRLLGAAGAVLPLPSVALPRTGLPSGVVTGVPAESVRLDPKPRPLEGADSTAPFDASSALGADSTALRGGALPAPLLPRLP